jgi:hypothetical protein
LRGLHAIRYTTFCRLIPTETEFVCFGEIIISQIFRHRLFKTLKNAHFPYFLRGVVKTVIYKGFSVQVWTRFFKKLTEKSVLKVQKIILQILHQNSPSHLPLQLPISTQLKPPKPTFHLFTTLSFPSKPS